MTSGNGSPQASQAHPLESKPLPGQVVLVMQGGGAPGVYHAGAYQALHEAGIEPDWVIGTSIGAINGAIIAGNQVAHRLERLREFWARLETGSPGPWSSLTPLLAGVPGFYYPNPAAVWGVDAKVGIEQASLYSVDPLKKLLPGLVDFNLVNSGKPRFTLGLVGVRNGQIRYFDSRKETIGLEHVLGSSAIPPSFPAVSVSKENPIGTAAFTRTPLSKWYSMTILGGIGRLRRSDLAHARARSPNPSRKCSCARRIFCSAAAPRAKSCSRPSFITCAA